MPQPSDSNTPCQCLFVGTDPIDVGTDPIDTFSDKLRALISPEQVQGNGRDPVATSHHEAEAENLVVRAFGLWDMRSGPASLEKLRKGDPRKVLVAALVRKNTSVGNRWLAERLAMGHTASVSRHVSGFLKVRKNQKKLEELEIMLKCNT